MRSQFVFLDVAEHGLHDSGGGPRGLLQEHNQVLANDAGGDEEDTKHEGQKNQHSSYAGIGSDPITDNSESRKEPVDDDQQAEQDGETTHHDAYQTRQPQRDVTECD